MLMYRFKQRILKTLSLETFANQGAQSLKNIYPVYSNHKKQQNDFVTSGLCAQNKIWLLCV